MAWVLPPKDTPPITSMMLLVISALSPAVLIRIPVLWPGLVSENPSTVTFGAAVGNPIVIIPVTVDSPTPNTRPATGWPARAPLRVRVLPIVTFSTYPPAATLIGLHVGSLTAD